MRLKFSPLFYDDGSPCYFRAICLALFASCLILHVFLKDSQSQVVLSAEDHSVSANTTDKVINANGSQIDRISERVNANQAGLTQASNQVVTDQDDDKSSWSIFNAFKDRTESSAEKLLQNQRVLALTEMLDGASFLVACGDINASYKNCKFTFSDKVKANYSSQIVFKNDLFIISLKAKGQQSRDLCSQFIISSDGRYQAYDYNGNVNSECLLQLENNAESFISSRLSKQLKNTVSTDNSAGALSDNSI